MADKDPAATFQRKLPCRKCGRAFLEKAPEALQSYRGPLPAVETAARVGSPTVTNPPSWVPAGIAAR